MSDTAPAATTESKENHGGPGDGPAIAEPTHEVAPARRRTPGEEARTLVDAVSVGSLASLSEDGTPWASVVAFGATGAGEPVLVVSTMAEHGRNLAREPRCSVAIAEPVPEGDDPLDRARITLAGHVIVPEGEEAEAALEAHARHYPFARGYAPVRRLHHLRAARGTRPLGRRLRAHEHGRGRRLRHGRRSTRPHRARPTPAST